MAVNYSISRWVDHVPSKQWQRDGIELAEIGSELPSLILDSRPLADVHRLDLALFVVFEEASLRVSGALTRRAPTEDSLYFAAQQTLDEARHYEIFRTRLGAASDASGTCIDDAKLAIQIPPLKRFVERCYEVADAGSFLEALVLMNLVLEGMAYPLYAYEERYWRPVDPYLARMIKSAFLDETRHVAFGAAIVKSILDDDPGRKAIVRTFCADARKDLDEVFRYYVRTFVGLFDATARRHKDVFAGAEFAPGHLIAETPYQDQVAMIHKSINDEHARLLARAGL